MKCLSTFNPYPCDRPAMSIRKDINAGHCHLFPEFQRMRLFWTVLFCRLCCLPRDQVYGAISAQAA